MNEDEPNLEDDFYMCLPTNLHGFNMQKKEWSKSGLETTPRSLYWLTFPQSAWRWATYKLGVIPFYKDSYEIVLTRIRM